MQLTIYLLIGTCVFQAILVYLLVTDYAKAQMEQQSRFLSLLGERQNEVAALTEALVEVSGGRVRLTKVQRGPTEVPDNWFATPKPPSPNDTLPTVMSDTASRTRSGM